jgi:3-hydroxyisobutyrate dehydrogenase
MLDSPVSGGPGGAASGKMAVWVGGDEQQYNRHASVLGAMADQAKYIGPIGAGTIVKLVHNCTTAMVSVALAEVMTMGIKAGVEPMELWEAVRQGSTGRARTFDRLGKFFAGQYDPADFALRLLHKDVGLAVALGKEVGVPMRLANMTLEDLTEAMGRGWQNRDSRSPMILQVERAGIEQPNIPIAKTDAVIADKSKCERHARAAPVSGPGLQHGQGFREQDPRRRGRQAVRLWRGPRAGGRCLRLHDPPAGHALGPRLAGARHRGMPLFETDL